MMEVQLRGRHLLLYYLSRCPILGRFPNGTFMKTVFSGEGGLRQSSFFLLAPVRTLFPEMDQRFTTSFESSSMSRPEKTGAVSYFGASVTSPPNMVVWHLFRFGLLLFLHHLM